MHKSKYLKNNFNNDYLTFSQIIVIFIYRDGVIISTMSTAGEKISIHQEYDQNNRMTLIVASIRSKLCKNCLRIHWLKLNIMKQIFPNIEIESVLRFLTIMMLRMRMNSFNKYLFLRNTILSLLAGEDSWRGHRINSGWK